MRDDFAIFILTHGRPDKVYTLNTLEKSNYNGKWYLIVDNEDKTLPQYKEKYGEHVVVFDRVEQHNNHEFDIGDNFDSQLKRNTIVYARNKCFDICKQLGLTYFWEFEDDYLDFTSRKAITEHNLTQTYVQQWDEIVDAFIEFLECSPMIQTVAFSQIGDWLGGIGSQIWQQKITRKAMNTFMCKVDRPFQFLGRMNDDVNAYVTLGARCVLFMTVRDLILRQQETQKTKSGNSDMYKTTGTYTKSFYSVMMNPSSVSINIMGQTHKRVHHSINWNNAVPKIVSDKFRNKE